MTMMLTIDSIPTALRTLTRDGWLLFLTRFVRLFAYGSLSVVLVFYLISLGLSESQTGMLLTLTLVGDTVVSLYLTTRADRIGRRRMLVAGALLLAAAGLVFASASSARAAMKWDRFCRLSRRRSPTWSPTGAGPKSSRGTRSRDRWRPRSV